MLYCAYRASITLYGNDRSRGLNANAGGAGVAGGVIKKTKTIRFLPNDRSRSFQRKLEEKKEAKLRNLKMNLHGKIQKFNFRTN